MEHISEPEAAVKIAAADKQTVAAKTEAKDAKETPVKKTEAKDAKETPAELKADVSLLAKVRSGLVGTLGQIAVVISR